MNDNEILKFTEARLDEMRKELGPDYSVSQFFNEHRVMMTEIRHIQSGQTCRSNHAMDGPVANAKMMRAMILRGLDYPDERGVYTRTDPRLEPYMV